MRLISIVVFMFSLLFAASVAAQTNVRAAYSNGQIFVVWDLGAANPPLACVVYRSAGPVAQIGNATRVGACFLPEWQGERLKIANAAYQWRIPAGGPFSDNTGVGLYQLSATEGLFVATPHASGSEYFAVAADTAGALVPANWTSATVAYICNPALDPVTCHLQMIDSDNGRVRRIYAMWADGADDESSGRVDFPIMGNAAKNGAPSVFAITEGTHLPNGPMPAVFTMHGGEGDYTQLENNAPNAANMGLDLDYGIVVSHDDAVYLRDPAGVPMRSRTNYIGYVRNLNPLAPTWYFPPNGSIVVPYTCTRIRWITEWVRSRSSYNVDANRISLIGFSSGSEGCIVNARLHPELYNAAVACGPGMDGGGSVAPNPVTGSESQNLETTIIGPEGASLHVLDLEHPAVRISATERDFPLMRIFIGRNESSVPWTADRVGNFVDTNAAARGVAMYWDRRNHVISQWDTNEGGQAATACGYDVGEWVVPPPPIAPGRTERASAAYATRYRKDRSYPAFFDDDQDLARAGRQPDIGDGQHCTGEWWGTWAGYYDWELDTIVDTATDWQCTVYLRGNSAVAIDNAPFRVAQVSLVPRRTQAFHPAPGALVYWAVRVPQGGSIVQFGSAVAEADGAVRIIGLLIPREDVARARVEVSTQPLCPADFNVDGVVDLFDYLDFVNAFSAQDQSADFNDDGVLDFFDYLDFVQAFSDGC